MVIHPIAPGMFVSSAFLRMARVSLTNSFFLCRIGQGRCPLTPIVPQSGYLFGMILCITRAAVCRTNVLFYTVFRAGRFLCYSAFVINTFCLPYLCLAGKAFALAVMSHYPLTVNFLGSSVPIGPSMLRIFYGAATFCAIYNVMNAVAGISPIVGVISAGFFTGVILVIFTAAIRTGDPVS